VSERGRFLRDHAFLVAAIALPVAVAALFILASAIPRWTVPPPAYDLVLRAVSYESSPAKVSTDVTVRDGVVEVTVRPAAPNTYPQPSRLFLFDHETGRVRALPLDLPAGLKEGESKTLRVDALAGRIVRSDATAPDGYSLDTSSSGGSGLVGDLFGMSRYRQNLSLVNRGRAIPLVLPTPYQSVYVSAVSVVGWIVDDGAR
jgi:hypothetical protein